MDLGLQNRVVVVTGGTAGIGLATTQRLVKEGAAVVTAARGSAPGVGEALHVVANLAEPGEPQRVVETAEAHLGRVDVLINNVGLAVIRRFEDVTDDDWNLSLRMNLLSAIRATSAALPGMRERGSGAIVNVASTAGRRPSLGMPDYSVMKAALLAYTHTVAEAHASEGIRCNAVIPGPTLTPAWTARGGLAEQQGHPQEVLARAAAARLLGRFAEPVEIADVIVFLASSRAAHITAAEWSVSGGTVP